MKKIAPYGSWPSPITAKLVASASPGIALPSLNKGNINFDCIYWLESRPDEAGRNTVVRKDREGQHSDLIPAPYSARSRVHEYGGACYVVVDDALYFVNQADQRIYRIDTVRPDAKPEALTAGDAGYRFADFDYDQRHHRLICVCEQHGKKSTAPNNFISAISLSAPHDVVPLVFGEDFYAYPRLNPDGTQLTWLSWNHPSMPWYDSELWEASVDESGAITHTVKIAGGVDEAIFQPQWSEDGQLYFVSDRNGWWNIYRREDNGETAAVTSLDAEFATPLWSLGMSCYTFCGPQHIVCCYTQDGSWQLTSVEISTNQIKHIDSPYTEISALVSRGQLAWFIGASSEAGNELVRLNIRSGDLDPIHSFSPPCASSMLSQPQSISYQTTNDEQSHAFYYPPYNDNYDAEENDRPPLIVICHGGPTGATSTGLNLKIQFWTSRGFAILDINYRGSTGYGRRYRELLDGDWGVSDVADVVMGAQYLVEHKLVDPNKIAIRGSSAGGYTVLAALVFYDIFKAGASHYGIGDLETLARDTHKFEAQYLERLIGPYPEQADLYRDRSPVHHTDKLNCPIIFFQGLDDKVVPPQQAEAMVEILKKQGLEVAYFPFEGEGHGFRRAENIATALYEELRFYSNIFNFSLIEHH
jgi:dipeptidyl aminopeptidase/acylaminoacyl peptidase